MNADSDPRITGVGAVCALGRDVTAIAAAIGRGASGIAPIRRFSTADFGVHLAATVPGWPGDDPPWTKERARELVLGFALAAAREAIESAGIEVYGRDVPLVLGTGMGDQVVGIDTLTRDVGDALGLTGPRLTVSTACTSSTHAIGLARDLVARGGHELVLVGGADVLTPELFAGFHVLGALSPAPCAPFSLPVGTTMGEGAGFLVLEHPRRAAARSRESLAAILGYGLAGDAFHATAPDPRGHGVSSAMRAALRDAAMEADQLGYINAHGTGTAANDAAEWHAIREVLGAAADRVPLSSSKAMLGHAQGAAGVLELVVTLLCMANDEVPPTLHHRGPRPRAPLDPVADVRPRAHRHETALSISAAFGGANAAVIVGRPRRSSPLDGRAARRAHVHVVGVASCGPRGDAPVWDRLPIRELLPRADPRDLDPSSAMLSATVATALARADVRPTATTRAAIGLMVGQLGIPAAASEELRRSIDARGLAKLCANAFAAAVPNAAAGTCSRAIGLCGPLGTLAAENASGLLALIHAAELLSSRSELRHMIAAAVDEPDEEARTHGAYEGAAAIVLAEHPRAGAVELAGWAIAGAEDPRGAVEAALAHAAVTRAAVTAVVGNAASLVGWDGPPPWELCESPGAGATPPLLAITRAYERLQSVDTVVVVHRAPRSLCAAVVLRRNQENA